jgi:peptidoglycan/xylan/chitin deacetylase (PgdA/CDA1 family)
MPGSGSSHLLRAAIKAVLKHRSKCAALCLATTSICAAPHVLHSATQPTVQIAPPPQLGRLQPITEIRQLAAPQNFALTFDDGPHPVHTPVLLDWLKVNHIRATFFVLGKNAERYPGIVKRMIQEGHEVGNHSWSHPNLRVMPPKKMLAEVRRAHDLITRITGRAPVLFRPPYGALSASQQRLIEQEFATRS